MNMKNNIFAAFFLALLSGCSLDPEISFEITPDQASVNYDYARNRATGMYSPLKKGFQYIGDVMMASATDEAEFVRPWESIQNFNRGSWNQFTNPDDVWSYYFEAIRRTNVFLADCDNVNLDRWKNDPTETAQLLYQQKAKEVAYWKLEARFLRAYYHFELIKRYGGIPIMEDALSISDPYSEIKREPLQDVVDFIVSECTELSDPETGLPDVYDLPADNLGRATRGAALALKSRVLLYAASDLYNDDSWTGGYAHPEYVTMSDETTRAQKWEAAANAALEVINSPANYSLGAYGDIGKVYNGNPEIIFVISEAEANSFERVNFPIGYEGGSSGNNPTQNLMEAYPNSDGSDFKWDNILYGSGDVSPYENRDPRLALSLVTNDSYLYNRNVEIWEGGRDASPIEFATTTGYYLRKMLNTELDLYNNRMSVHAWPVFRLGEIYLNYAEALNEYDPGNADIAVYLDKLRTRSDVSMPGMAASLTASGKSSDQATVREYIRNERRIELAFEDHRAWDVRRWMEGQEAFGSPIYGVKVTKTVEGKFQYEKVQVEERTFSPQMYFYPIPQNEINIMGWPQNPLW